MFHQNFDRVHSEEIQNPGFFNWHNAAATYTPFTIHIHRHTRTLVVHASADMNCCGFCSKLARTRFILPSLASAIFYLRSCVIDFLRQPVDIIFCDFFRFSVDMCWMFFFLSSCLCAWYTFTTSGSPEVRHRSILITFHSDAASSFSFTMMLLICAVSFRAFCFLGSFR